MTSNAEVLLALRAPGADWLATLITALDESCHDPAFTPHLTAVFADLAQRFRDEGGLPPAIIEAAYRRTQDFSSRLTADLADACDSVPEPAEQPRLRLVQN